MKRLAIIFPGSICCLLGIALNCSSQPFIDLINIQYLNSPNRGIINQDKNPASLEHFSVQATVPIQLRNKKDIIIVSPFFDDWRPGATPASKDFCNQTSTGLPVSFLKWFGDSDWSLLSTVIVRRNGYKVNENSNWQIGGALIANFKASETLTYKAGLYLNREFFGLFAMPLVGIDWQISRKTNLFGVLPGSLTLERKLGKKIYSGASFRAITSSFKTVQGFWRLDENRLGIFFDYYLMKKFVGTVEAGHSILRKMRTGIRDKRYNDWQVNDNMYVKISLAHRLRFR